MVIDSNRFNVPRKIHIRFLEDQIEKWFFLLSARVMAQRELNRRKKEIDRG
jgi:hypothetical protein